jgi:hypothetical protein
LASPRTIEVDGKKRRKAQRGDSDKGDSKQQASGERVGFGIVSKKACN